MKPTVCVRRIGYAEYDSVLETQRAWHADIVEGTQPSTVITVTHPPVITIGRRGVRSDILVSDDILRAHGIAVRTIERGGQVTYHGPGQLVVYPLLNLRLFGKDVHILLRGMEQAVIEALQLCGITGIPGEESGVFVDGYKICSIGIAVRKWVSYHGLSLNVREDKNFRLIRPCGHDPERISSLQELGYDFSIKEMEERVLTALQRTFNYERIDNE